MNAPPPPPPPPPPPHGANPRTTADGGSGLPPGNYDIFIVPPHSAGSGFLYLPSLQPQMNSYIAGFASATILCYVWFTIQPAVQAWWLSVKTSGGAGILVLMAAIGFGAWALGRQQSDTAGGPASGGASPAGGPSPGAQGFGHGYASNPPPGTGSPPPPRQHQHQHNSQGGYGNTTPNAGQDPKPGWQQRGATGTGYAGPGAASTSGQQSSSSQSRPAAGARSEKSAWERAREETKRREEERRAKEAEQKRKDDIEKRLRELREKEAKDREAREYKAKEAREALEKEAAAKERLERLKLARERLEREKAERLKADQSKKETTKEPAKTAPSTYAFSAVGEKTNPWPHGRPAAARSEGPSSQRRPVATPSPTKSRPEAEAHSFRPYDTPKTSPQKASSIYSETSYAASYSTSRTTPPPSQRGAYSTKDPDKVMLKAVYTFPNSFAKTPTSQLVSGVGPVTDGLILRITTEGLFIDDDVRHVPQREWDIKAWTLKQVEVWCPSFRADSAASASANHSAATTAARISMRRLWGLEKEKPATAEEMDALLESMSSLCRAGCSSAASESTAPAPSPLSNRTTNAPLKFQRKTADKDVSGTQTGENRAAGLHIIRVGIRDQEGKKYVFVVPEEESWKIGIGIQRLRGGSQVRALGVAGMSTGDSRGMLESLGWL